LPLLVSDLDDNGTLTVEKLDLLLKIPSNERVTWSGRHLPRSSKPCAWRVAHQRLEAARNYRQDPFQYELTHCDRYLTQFGVGTMLHRQIMREAELFATRVSRRNCTQ
jgi:hypothetical protein